MLLIAFALALLVISTGMKLLIHIQKETLGNIYKYVSWFVIVMGFLLLIFTSCFGVVRFCYKGGRMMESKFRMMEEMRNTHGYMMEGKPGNCMRMSGHGRNMRSCSADKMMMGECCGDEMENGSCERGNYHEKSGEGCHFWKRECGEESEECAMKKGDVFKKDTIKKNKHPH